MSSDYTRPGVEAWWEHDPAHWCPTCNTFLRDSYGVVRDCPFGCEVAA